MPDVFELPAPESVVVTTASAIRLALRADVAAGRHRRAPVELVSFLVLIVCTDGSGRHMVDFTRHAVTAGSALVVRPGQVQRWELSDDFDAHVVVFGSGDVPGLVVMGRVLGAATLVRLGRDRLWVEQTLTWLADDLRTTDDQAMAGWVVGVVLEVVARHAPVRERLEDSPSHRIGTAFAESIERHLDQRSVSWHAKAIGVSTRSLTRSTDSLFGQTPKALIDARTLLEAQRRLARSADPIGVIARSLGFTDQSSFARFYRQRTGVSPSTFRANGFGSDE